MRVVAFVLVLLVIGYLLAPGPGATSGVVTYPVVVPAVVATNPPPVATPLPLPVVPTPDTSQDYPGHLLSAVVECAADHAKCAVSAVVYNTTDAIINGRFIASVVGGILFVDAAATDPALGADRRVSHPFDVEVAPNEQRAIPFNYVVDPSTRLAGTYIASLTVEQNGLLPLEAVAPIYVRLDSGMPRLLDSRAAYTAQVMPGAVAGLHDVRYRLQINGTPPAQTGILFLEIGNSLVDESRPEIELAIDGGVAFAESPLFSRLSPTRIRIPRETLDAIVRGGTRVVEVPLRVDDDSLGGDYTLKMTRRGGAEDVAESGPLAIRIAVDPVTGGRWIDGAIAVEPYPVSPDPQFFSPPQPSAPQDDVAPALTGGGGVPATTPAAAEPAVTPSPTAAEPTAEPPLTGWNRTVSGLSGNRWDVYVAHVDGPGALDWETFMRDVVVANPILEKNGFVFDPDKTYWLPALP